MSDNLRDELDTDNSNNTDYSFPPWWGILQRRVDDDRDSMTKEEADQIRSDWYTMVRSKRQAIRQHDAGMWEEFGDVEGVPLREAMEDINDDEYQLK
jgi:hypothetical protein